MAGSMGLSKVLDETEIETLSDAIKDKLERHLNNVLAQAEDFKSKYDKVCVNSEQQYFEIEKQLIESNTKLEAESSSNIQLREQLKELETNYAEASSRLKNVQETQEGNLTTQLRLTKANDHLEIEKRELAVLLEKRNIEIDRLNDDLKDLSKKLAEADTAKFETLAKMDEIHSNEVNKEYQMKRLEQEKMNLSKQNEWLNRTVDEKTKELMNVRRERSTKVMEVQSKLEEKTDECASLQNTVETLKKTNTDQSAKIDNYIQRIKDLQDSNSQSDEQFRQEIQARVRLVDLYKKSVEESENQATELTGAVTELQKLLKEAAKAHTDMEQEKEQEALRLTDEIANRDEKISNLEQELINANDLLCSVKSQGLSEDRVETMFPTAAATSKLLKSGMTLTQIYNEYVQATDSLEVEKVENKRLNSYLDQILQEIEEKAPILKKQREDYEQALQSIDQMTRQLDAAMVDSETLRTEADEKHRKWAHVQKENQKHQQSLQDLSKQIRYLLKEVEELRGGRVVRDGDDHEVSSSEVSSSSRIITDRLVTFRSIEDLQVQNQRLLGVIREISEKKEEEENQFTDAKTRELKEQLELAQEELATLKDARNRQAEMVESIVRQRDMYRVLLQQGGTQMPTSFSMGTPSSSPNVTAAKSPESNKKLEETSRALKQLQADFSSYKKEKLENEKILNEQLEKGRQDLADLRVQNARLSSQLDYSSERYKALQGNAENYKKEIAHFREKSQTYSTSVAKHEQTINTLRQDLMSTKEQISQAQAKVDNVKAERDLIKTSEQRLSIELESLRRERHSQTMLMANLQTIQNNLERNEVETKQRLGKQIEALERDKVSLQKRLDAGERQQNVANKQWEHQVQEIRSQMETEMRSHQRSKDQLQSNHKQMMELKQQYATVTTKLSVAESRIFSLSGDEADRSSEEIADLKSQIAALNTEKESLQNQLEKSKQHVEQYKKIADGVQDTVQEQTKASEIIQVELEEQLCQAKEAQEHTEHKLELLEKERQDLLDQNIQITEENHKQTADLRRQLNSIQNELQEAVERRETAIAIEMSAKQECENKRKEAAEAQDKYERELMLHAADVEALTVLKQEMEGFNPQLMEKEEAIKSIEQKFRDAKASWAQREGQLNTEAAKKDELVKELLLETKALNEQMKKLSNQVISVQERAAKTPKKLIGTTPEEDSSKTSEQLLEVVRYLRREKDISDGKVEVVETEVARYRQKCETLEKQLETSNKDLADERQKAQAEVQTAAQHAELMQKVESSNLLMDTNKMLREENQKLTSQLTETEAKLKKLEEDIKPLQSEIREVQSQRDALAADKKAIVAEADRWRTRTNQLIEQSHKTDPEEHKKLIQEKEEIRKQLVNNTDELHKARSEATRLSQELAKLQNQSETQKQENTRLREAQRKAETDLVDKGNDIAEKTKTLIQLKRIGRKYKEQTESISKELEDKTAELETYKTETEAKLAESENYKTEYENCKSEFEKYKAQHDSQDKQVHNVQQANTDRIHTLEKQLKDLELGKEQVEKSLRDLMGYKTGLEQKLKEAEASSNDLNQKLKTSENQLKAQEETVKEKAQKLTETEQKLGESEQKVAAMTQRLSTLENKMRESDSKNVELQQKSENVNSETQKLKADLQRLQNVQQEFDKLKAEHTQLTEESSKVKEEKSEIEKKLARSSNILQVSKNRLQTYKENNDKLTAENNELKALAASGQSSSEEAELRQASLKSVYESRLEKLEAEIKQTKESANAEVEKAVEKLQKENEELQAKIHQLQHQVDMYQKTGTSQPQVHVSRPTVAASADRTSASPSEAPKTANIRPIASSPAAVKPQTVPVQPQSAASKATASIRPMAIAATSVAPLSTTTGTPTATVMPTTQSQQETDGDVSVPVQQLFPAQGTARPTQQVQRVIPTQEQVPDILDNQVIVEPQPSTSSGESRETTGTGANKRQREDTESPSEETFVKRTKVAGTEDQQEIPSITVTDENSETTGLSQDQNLSVLDVESHSQSSLDLSGGGDELEEGTEEQVKEEEEADDDDDDPVIVVGSDESGAGDDEYEEEEDEYEEDEDQEVDDVDIYEGVEGDIVYSQDDQDNEMQAGSQDDEAVVIIDEGDDEVQMESQEADSLPTSQSVPQSQQSLLPPVQTNIQIERQLSAGARNQLTPFMLGAQSAFEEFDDCRVPSTPTLMPPRRGDGFAEAVSSPAQLNQRFTFGLSGEQNLTIPGLAQLETQAALGMGMDDTRMDLSQLQEGSGRSVPSTPLSLSAPVNISETHEVIVSQSETSIATSQSESETQVLETESELTLEEGTEGEGGEDDILEGEQGEDDHHEEEHADETDEKSPEKEGASEETDQGAREDSEQSTSQERSQDSSKPKIQKIVWDSPAQQQTVPPPQNVQPIPSLSQSPPQFRGRGAPRGSSMMRGNRGYQRGQVQMARRSARGRGGMYMRRPY